VNTSRRGTPSVQRAMGCDTQSRSACTRQDRLRLRQRTHCPNLRKSSPNPRTDQSYQVPMGLVWPAQYFGILFAQGSVWSSESQSAWPVQYFGALEASARPPCGQSAWPARYFGALEASAKLPRSQSAWPARRFGAFEASARPPRSQSTWPAQYFGALEASARPPRSQSTWPAQYFRTLEASARPPRNQSAWPLLHFARIGPANKNNPNGLRGICGHVDDRRGQSA